MMELKKGTKLQGGKYEIKRSLGQGGFGITYLAEQVLLRRTVAVKEFFMKDCCERDTTTSLVTVGTGSQRELVTKFRGKFIREAQMMASMNHPNIVRVLDVFEENGTAYYVMEHLPGGSLSDKIKRDGPFLEHDAVTYIKDIASALTYIHSRNTVHLDVKPSNVLLDENGSAVLIDFGISKHYDDAGEQTSSTPVGISKGFAPLEQGRDGDVSQFKPSTDIYALGATLYYLLTGNVPPEASIVNEDGLERPSGISDCLWTAIEHAMQPRRKDRPQSIKEFMSLLDDANTSSGKASDKRDKTDDATVVVTDDVAINIEYTPPSASTISSKPKTNSQPDIKPAQTLQSKPAKESSKGFPKWLYAVIAALLFGLAAIFVIPKNKYHEYYSGVEEGHRFVDLGLSVKWATCNIGSLDGSLNEHPEDFGVHRSWGEIYNKSDFDWKTYVFCDSSSDKLIKYNNNSQYGIVDDITTLELEDDIAHKMWGGTWRMPTKDELDELCSSCTWKKIKYKGVKGFLVTSKIKGYEDCSIFLPFTGYYNRKGAGSYDQGFLWSSSLDTDRPQWAYYLNYSSKEHHTSSEYYPRYNGMCIRAVCDLNSRNVSSENESSHEKTISNTSQSTLKGSELIQAEKITQFNGNESSLDKTISNTSQSTLKESELVQAEKITQFNGNESSLDKTISNTSQSTLKESELVQAENILQSNENVKQLNNAKRDTNAPLSKDELKAAGFRFLKEYNKVKVILQPSNQSSFVYNDGSFLKENMYCYGGVVSEEGLLNGVAIFKSNDSDCYMAYVCEGKLAFPLLEVGYYDGGLYMSLQERVTSYGCIFPSWNGRYSDRGLCLSMLEVYDKDFSKQNVLREIYSASIDLNDLEKSFRVFVRSGNHLDDSWSDDPENIDRYEGFEPIVEGYKPGEFDENLDRNRPIGDGLLLYSQESEFYCDGVYDYNESRLKNGHALHIPDVNLNPNHFRVIFSIKALSNQGWCQGHSCDDQWPFVMDCGSLGIRLNADGSITIVTYDSDKKDHFYVTGFNYSINRYIDIDMEYDHGQLIINNHRFSIKTNFNIAEWCDNSIHSVNYSIGNAFKGYIKGIKIYSYSD